MDSYEKKYKEALGWMQSVYPTMTGAVKEDAEHYFLELKESEDERIRKSILELVRQSSAILDKQNQNSMIAWLEKQGGITKLSEEEQNRFAKGVLSSCAMSFIDYLDAHKYEGKMCVSNGECVDIENAFHNAMWDRLHRYYCKYIEKQSEQKPNNDLTAQEAMDIAVAKCFDEQKPAWSEEDEHRAKDAIYFLDTAKKHYASTVELDACIDWLKSIKERIKG